MPSQPSEGTGTVIRNLKAFGIALVATFVMSGAIAAAASAALFHSEGTGTTLSGGQTTQHRLGTTTGTVICSTITFTGTMANPTEETITLAPIYTGCEFEGLFEVAIATNSCKFEFSASSATEGGFDIVGCSASLDPPFSPRRV
jgi:hypothetical protein